jgi:hypothetical protein
VLECKLNDLKQAVVDKVLIQRSSAIRLQTFCNGAALLYKQYRILLPLQTGFLGTEYGEQFLQKRYVSLQVLHDVDLVEEDERIED